VSVSCTKREREYVEIIRVEDADNTADSSTDKNPHLNSSGKLRAEKLVVMAEKLISPISFFFADEILNEALKADPNNFQAQFDKALIAPSMELRGFLRRIQERSYWLNYQSEIGIAQLEGAKGAFRDFLWEENTGPDLLTESDVQELAVRIMEKNSLLIDLIKKHRRSIAHIVHPIVPDFGSTISACEVVKLSPGTYKILPCPFSFSHELLKLNQGDMEALIQILHSVQLVTATTVSYDATGYFNYMNADSSGPITNPQKSFAFLRALPGSFGQLKNSKLIRSHLGSLTEIYGSYRWLKSMQPYVCTAKRHGFLLGQELLCLESKDASLKKRGGFSLEQLEKLFEIGMTGAAGTLEFSQPKTGHITEKKISSTLINPFALLTKPVLDIKTLFPDKFDECKSAISYQDPTFGGTFPNGDAADLLLYVHRKNRDGYCD
jgi:hypothetical protein